MSIAVRKDDAFDTARSSGQRIGDCGGEDGLEDGVAVLQPTPIQQREPRAAEQLRADLQELLSLRVDRSLAGPPTIVKVPLELVDRRGMERALEFLADDGLIVVVEAVEGPWKDEPNSPS
jgi:hypothetical protein